MNPNCKCGGRFRSLDPVKEVRAPGSAHSLYQTVRLVPGYATWRCDTCKKLQRQKLRQAKEHAR